MASNLESRALDALKELRARLDQAESERREPIAIVGLATRFPGKADSEESFWKLLADGVDASAVIPTSRFDVERIFDPDPSVPGKTHVKRASFVDDVESFDASFFGISPVEARALDPQQRMLLEVTHEALSSAGHSGEEKDVGVFVGVMSTEFQERFGADLPADVAPYVATGNGHYPVANRVSYALDLKGPSIVVDGACASSLLSLHLASRSLRARECEVAVAGGVGVMLSPLPFIGGAKLGALARDGRCKAWDASADGYGRGEGCGIVVLKRLSDARRDGDRIRALLRGSACNHAGRSAGFTVPSSRGQARLLRAALLSAGVSADAVQYVEAHGTGTVLGDPIEVEALTTVFGDRAGAPLAIGTVKTNIGHLEAAAGVAGVIKTVLALEHRLLPPSLHFRTPNPHIPFDQIPIRVQTALGPWPTPGAPLVAGVSSFGLSGTNAHVVLEEAPPERPEERAAADAAAASGVAHALTISAKTPEALRAYAAAYAERLAQPLSDGTYRDVAYTASCRRPHHEHRLAVVGKSAVEWERKLRAHLAGGEGAVDGRAADSRRPLAMVFSGQGTQWWAMGRELLEMDPVFRAAVERCAEQVDARAPWRLLDELRRDEASTRLAETEIAQPALFALQTGLFALWTSWGIEPDVVVGHSVGEIAAAHVAGALSLEAAASLAVARGRILQKATGRGKMAAVAMAADEAEKVVRDFPGVEVAASNGPRATTLSGEPGALAQALAMLRARGIDGRELHVNYAFHSAQMDELAEELTRALGDGWQVTTPRIRMLSSVTAETAPPLDARYWGAQVRKRVRFHEAIGALLAEGVGAFVEVGPHPVLLPAVEQTSEAAGATVVAVPSLRRREPERESMLGSLAALHCAGHPVDWRKLYAVRGRTVDVPRYPWQRQRFALPSPTRDAPKALGPLIDTHTELARGSVAHVFEVEVDTATPRFAYLRDHVLLDEIWMPGIGQSVMVCDAGQRAYGAAFRGLADVAFPDPLRLAAPRRVQITLAPLREGRAAFEVLSRPLAGPNEWTVHATGSVLVGDMDAAPPPPDRASMERATFTTPPSALYREIASYGLHYGASFTLVESIRRDRAGLTVATLAAPAGDPLVARPALLDAALHAGVDGDAMGFRSMGRFRVFAPLDRVRSSILRTPPREDEGGTAWFLDASGAVVATAWDVKVFSVTQRHAEDRFLNRLEWRPLASASTPAVAQPWVLVTARKDAALAASAPLRAAGGDVRIEERVSEPAPAHFVFPLHLEAAASPRAPFDPSALVDAARRLLKEPNATLTVVTPALSAVGKDAIDPRYATVAGVMATLTFEASALRPRLVEVDEGVSAQAICDELRDGGGEPWIALRAGRRYAPRLTLFRDRPDADRSPPTLRADATYLVTGGLGEIGRSVVAYLVEQGARNVVTVQRSAEGDAARAVFEPLRRSGATIRSVQADVSRADELRRVLDDVRRDLPPLRGIVHLAAVLAANKLESPAGGEWALSAAKVMGAWKLHELTAGDPLDFFVMFSSLSSLLGMKDGSFYAGANSFLDSLAHHRRAAGLPAASIAWAEWEGRTTDHDELRAAFSGAEGGRLLGRAIRSEQAYLVAARYSLGALRMAALAPILSELRVQGAAGAGADSAETSSLPPVAEIVALPAPQRQAALMGVLTRLLSSVSGVEVEQLGPTVTLGAVGFDSLLVLRARQRLSRWAGRNIPTSVLAKRTVADVADALLEQLSATGAKTVKPLRRLAR